MNRLRSLKIKEIATRGSGSGILRVRRTIPLLFGEKNLKTVAEGVGFEPTVQLPVRLISSQHKRPREKWLSLVKTFHCLSTIVDFCAE
jgi:hypothetical protein